MPPIETAASIGHNRPDPTPAITEQLASDYRSQDNAIAELEEAGAKLPVTITNDEQEAAALDHIAKLRSAAKAVEGAREAEKDVYLVSGRAVDGFFKKLDERIGKARKPVWDETERYKQEKLAAARRAAEERARLAREEADRLRREAAEREAAAAASRRKDHKATHTAAAAEAREAAIDAGINALEAKQATTASAADLTRTRTTAGTVGTMKTVWKYQIDDVTKVDLNAIRAQIPVAEVEKAIARFVNLGGRELKGVTIYSTEELAVR